MIDSDAIKQQIECQNVVRVDLGEPAKRSGGIEYWLCPFHADSDASLAVYEHGGWKCYGCGETGDVITWVMKRQGVDFRGACEILSDGNLDSFNSDERVARAPKPLQSAPVGDWQSAAKAFMLRSEEHLWSDKGEGARRYLAEERGLTETTIREWRLGYNPVEIFEKPAKWGLSDGKRKAIWLPRAIVIPHVQGDTVWSIKFRLPEPFRGSKYYSVAGSQYDLYGCDKMRGRESAFLCEGEFDTILLWGIVGDLADVLTFGAASIRDARKWSPDLLRIKHLYLAFDNDVNETGDKAAEWAAAYRKLSPERVLPPGGHKDITDAWAAGEDLRAWVRGVMGIGRDPEPDYVTMALPADTLLPTVPGKWRRLGNGEIEATYTRRELTWAMGCVKGNERQGGLM